MASRPAESRAQPRYGVLVDRAARAFASLPLEARQILRLCDGRRTLTRIRKDSPIDRARTEQVLRRLEALGLITDLAWSPRADERPAPLADTAPLAGRPVVLPLLADASPAAPETTLLPRIPPIVVVEPPHPDDPFSAEEEAFFSSGIEHLVADELN